MPTAALHTGPTAQNMALQRAQARRLRRRYRPTRIPTVTRRLSGLGTYDDLEAKGGIFRHGGPKLSFQQLNTRSYNDGTLGQIEEKDLAWEINKLTVVVGAVGLMVAGILFNQLLDRSRR